MKMPKKVQWKNMKTVIKILIICGLIGGIYYFVTHHSSPANTEITEDNSKDTTETNSDENSPLTPSPEGDDSVILNEDQGNDGGSHLTEDLSLPQEKATWTVSYGNDGFSPRNLSIKKGDTVRFVNNSDEDMWVASNPHPVHTDLSGFDAGHAYTSNQIFIYTFNQQGTWGYHNHVHSSSEGSVIVK